MICSLKEILKACGAVITENPKPLTGDELLQKQLEWSNAAEGHLNEKDGYDCKECLNRGFLYKMQNAEIVSVPCKCMSIRKSISRLEASGLKNDLKRFSEYEAAEDWQKIILYKAKKFSLSDFSEANCFCIGGQSGAGKTHICTAISRELMLRSYELLYMRWVTEIEKLKSYDESERFKNSDRFSECKVLYIDDLFKPAGGGLTPSDIRKTFDIIDRRCGQSDKITIISGERTFDELRSIDDAVAGRIYKAAGYGEYVIDIPKDPHKNYRYMGGKR